MTLIDLLRKVVDRGTRQRQEASLAGLLCCLLACVARAVLAWIEFLNKFALLWAAMTGQAFIDSGPARLMCFLVHGQDLQGAAQVGHALLAAAPALGSVA
jgi:hypothetical protein